MTRHRLLISLVVNMLLLATLIAVLTTKEQQTQSLKRQILPNATYVARHDKDYWLTDSPEGYYLFTSDDNRLTVRSFDQHVIFSHSVTFIGNGVYKIDEQQGFLIYHKDTIELKLSQENSLLYPVYRFFAN